MTLHLARLQARQDEAQYIRSPEESKERCEYLQREIDREEKSIEAAAIQEPAGSITKIPDAPDTRHAIYHSAEFERGVMSRLQWTDALHATYFALFGKQAPESMKACDISHAIVDFKLEPAGSGAANLQATKDETRGDVCEGNAPRLLAESPSTLRVWEYNGYLEIFCNKRFVAKVANIWSGQSGGDIAKFIVSACDKAEQSAEPAHPGLGSGALRERLCERITSYLTLGGLFNAELANHDAVRELLIDCRVGLSLSSPIEPQPEVEAWNEGYDAGFGAATLKHTNPEEFARRAEHTKEVVMRAVAKWEGIEAKPTSQASSEIREALETRIVNLKANLEHWRDINARLKRGETVNVLSSNESYHGDEISFLEKILEALAPSRQGAAKRVEG